MGRSGNLELILSLWDPGENGAEIQVNYWLDKTQVQYILQSKGKVKVAQSCPTLWDRMDCIVHGILQARILECLPLEFLDD